MKKLLAHLVVIAVYLYCAYAVIDSFIEDWKRNPNHHYIVIFTWVIMVAFGYLLYRIFTWAINKIENEE